MDHIIEPNDSFDFSKISLAHPMGIQGGAYFTKIEYHKKPLYIQTIKSLTRQGIVKSGKKYHCDLMFDKNAETLIHWFEKLEEKCKQLIYEKKDAWFQGNLEESDIENAFTPLIRVYKSGKYYLVRTNIKNTKEDMPSVKIYNENEVTLTMNDITLETELISILEIQGIKFSSRTFQIEIELKQMMVLDNDSVFESCLIKSNKKNKEIEPTIDLGENHEGKLPNLENYCIDPLEDSILGKKTDDETLENSNTFSEKIDTSAVVEVEEPIVKEDNYAGIDIEFEELNELSEEKANDLQEITNLNLEKNEQTITLKKPNQVYFELYKEAREKAKQAKKNAIIAYLEAKNIKKTYMIDNLSDSESDIDAEIDDVSESELEYL